MSNETNQMNTLLTWWNDVTFNGKEFCDLNKDHELILKKTPSQQERILSALTPENADHVIKALVDKFPEVENHIKEFEKEWISSDDQLKLIGKVTRLRDYLMHTNAIGDFEKLFQKIVEWEQTISALIEKNYKAKLELIENAEKASKESDDWKAITQLFKEINDQLKNIGFVDRGRNDQLTERLESARNSFFERKRQHHEDQEKEMLQNLDLKMEVVEKAEAITNSENWKEGSEIYRNLMEEWKAIGRTMHDKNEELWNRFMLAKNNFFARKKDHSDKIQIEQEENYIKKLALVEQAEALKDSTAWSKTSEVFASLMEEWKKIGRVPNEKSDEIWNRWNAAKDFFFQNKRQHHESIRISQEDNYAQKLALTKRAEQLKHSNNWREATEELNELMNDWKKIGPVPREYSDDLWEQFISARKTFFTRKDEEREKRKEQTLKKIQFKHDKTKSFLQQLENELKDEQQKLIDFSEALSNITHGNKEEELRIHLNKLINETENKIKHKTEKVEHIKQELAAIQNNNVIEKEDTNN